MLTIRLDGPGCVGCSRMRERALSLPAEGKRLDGPLFVDVVLGPPRPAGQDVEVDVQLRQAAARVIRRDGTLGAASPEERATMRFTLAWDDGWYVLYIARLSGSASPSASATGTAKS